MPKPSSKNSKFPTSYCSDIIGKFRAQKITNPLQNVCLYVGALASLHCVSRKSADYFQRKFLQTESWFSRIHKIKLGERALEVL